MDKHSPFLVQNFVWNFFPMCSYDLKHLKVHAVVIFKIKLHVPVSFEESSLQGCKFKISVKTGKPFVCSSNFVYCSCLPYCVSLIMVTITGHIFINFFQMKQFSAVKFDMGYEKSMSFQAIPKSPKVLKKFKR